MNRLKWAGLFGLAVLASPLVQANIASTFETGSEGWQVVSFADFSQDNYSVSGFRDRRLDSILLSEH